jgi:cyclopropane-fatty-acyl-phospholipid synthase
MNSKEKIMQLLHDAGIIVNGTAPTDITVRDERLYARVLSGGSLAAGESYVDGWWDVADLSGFFCKLLQSDMRESLGHVGAVWYVLRAYLANMQNQSRSFKVGEEHYDIGNDLYEKMLGENLVYTCGYWKDAQTLDEAQDAKLDLVCRKINLKAGDSVLDVGCGWGSFAKFAAEKYGARVTGITISKEQAALARERCAGLPVEILLQDYRDTRGSFDHIISIGMFEHVGPKNYAVYMRKMHELLKDGGLFLLHTIGGNVSSLYSDPWIDQYIFPGGVLPSVAEIGAATEQLFIIEDWHNFGPDYDKTLMHWYANFEKSWDDIKNQYSERFFRMWRYYLLSCAGSFRARENQLWQIVLSKDGVPGGYTSIR